MKRQTDIAKDEYKLFKDQMNVININRKDGVMTEDGKIIEGEGYEYRDEYKDYIINVLGMD